MLNSILMNLKSKGLHLLTEFRHKRPFEYRKDLEPIVAQIKQDGYAVIENFYSAEECAILQNEVDRVIEKRKKEGNIWSDQWESDKRCFCAENDSNLIAEYHNDAYLRSVAENYFGGKIKNSNTLAAKIDYKEGNPGSGGGWHRDGNHFQFKAIIYLCDVEIQNGPFQIIKKSHKFARVLKDTITMGAEALNTRFTDAQVQKLIQLFPEDYKVLTAKAGTLIFADVSSIHAGMPLSEGGYRYTLFNYYYPSYVAEVMRKRFNTLAESGEYA